MEKFTLESKNIFDKAYSKLKFPLSEQSFKWVFLWDGFYKDIEWTEINDNVCLFVTFEGNRFVWGPVLPGNKLGETLSKCFSLCENYNVNHGIRKKPAVMYLPEELKGEYSSLDGFKLKQQGRDYIYKVADIIAFRGEKYKDKRNKKNFFTKNYEYGVEEYSAAKHKPGCIDLLDRWKAQKSVDKQERGKVEAEANVNKRGFDIAETLDINGMVVLIEGKIEGYIFGNRTSELMCAMFFGKTNLEIRGLSQFIFSEFLKKYFSDCHLVNDMDDWEVGYLEKSKLSYKPYMVKKSYMLVKDE